MRLAYKLGLGTLVVAGMLVTCSPAINPPHTDSQPSVQPAELVVTTPHTPDRR